MILLIIGILLFALLVVLHEYGHFLVAKRNGVGVEEFGVGFPPKLLGKTMGKGIFRGYYTLNLLPLGGFVRLQGEHDADTGKGDFGSVSTSAKLRIMLAGVLVNFVTALVLFTVVAWMGTPQLVDNQFKVASDSTVTRNDVFVSAADNGSPAAKAGLRGGDVIVSVDGTKIANADQLRAVTQDSAGQAVEVIYLRNGTQNTAIVQLNSEEAVRASQNTDNPVGYLGVVPSNYSLVRSTWSAPIVAIGLGAQFTWLTLKGVGGALGNLFTAFANLVTGNTQEAKKDAASAGETVSGPLGIFMILKQGGKLGLQFILFIVALISLTLAIMNILPIPALDGGRAFVMLLFRALKKPLLPATEEKIHGIGFAVLMLLFVVITVVDVKRFF